MKPGDEVLSNSKNKLKSSKTSIKEEDLGIQLKRRAIWRIEFNEAAGLTEIGCRVIVHASTN